MKCLLGVGLLLRSLEPRFSSSPTFSSQLSSSSTAQSISFPSSPIFWIGEGPVFLLELPEFWPERSERFPFWSCPGVAQCDCLRIILD